MGPKLFRGALNMLIGVAQVTITKQNGRASQEVWEDVKIYFNCAADIADISQLSCLNDHI